MSGTPEEFPGADAILRAWRDGMRPDPMFTVSEWADRHRMLSSRGSAEPGRWRTERTPYLAEVMDVLSPSHPAQMVVFMKGSQVGGTECGNNWIGYVVHHSPGPMLAVQPTTDLAKRFSDQRLKSLIEDTPVLRDRIAPARARDSGNRQSSKEFPGGVLVITGANSAVGLRSMPARYLFLDEVDAYPGDLDEEGDPIDLALVRSRTFGARRKAFLVSTPTIAGRSRIEREYETTDKRRFFLPCPSCGHMQWLRFERLIWDKGRPETVRYVCEDCEAAIREHSKTAMMAAGAWRPTAAPANPTSVGFHISALYSPIGWLSWEQIARDWEAAQGSLESLKTLRNTVLGETWRENGEAPQWQRLYDRRSEWGAGTVPRDGLLLTAGIDVQRSPGRVEIYVWAWGRARQSWLVDHVVIPGSPFVPGTWEAVREVLESRYPHEAGGGLPIALSAIDSGDGTTTTEVYSFVRKMGSKRAIAVKGRDAQAQPIMAGSKIDVRKNGKRIGQMKIWLVGSTHLKAEFYGQLNLDRPTKESGEPFPPGFVHLPVHVAGEEVCRQLVAEELRRVKLRTGFYRTEWHKTRDRNEALDGRVYARAAASLVGVDRWGEDRWAQLEREATKSLPAAPIVREPASTDGGEELEQFAAPPKQTGGRPGRSRFWKASSGPRRLGM